MKLSRRAVPDGAAASASVLRAVVLGLSTALLGVGLVLSFLVGKLARRVVTPEERMPDTRILDVDVAAQTITLARTPDTVLPGRYGLVTAGTTPYVKVGTVLQSDDTSVTRKLLTHIGTDDRLSATAAFSGWYYDRPEQLQLPFEEVSVPSALGACPAWLFPAGDGGTWVVQVHGRGTTRGECLRAVPLFAAAGITSLVVSYRNDGEAPRSRTGSYGLGATEWRDVDRAVAYARAHGAERILLMGWSMGGAIVLQTAFDSAHREHIVGLILESPVVDWRSVVAHQGKLAKVPGPLVGLGLYALERDWATPLTGADGSIPFDRLDVVTRAAELTHPVLVLHSDGDDVVPPAASVGLAAARPDLVELHRFDTARHTKLWNYDPDRWSAAIGDWLQRNDLTSRAAADS